MPAKPETIKIDLTQANKLGDADLKIEGFKQDNSKQLFQPSQDADPKSLQEPKGLFGWN